MATIAELILERGRSSAEHRRREGEQSARKWRGVGEILSGSAQRMIDARDAVQRSRFDLETRELEREAARQRVAAGQRTLDAVDTQQRQRASLAALVEMYGQDVPIAEIQAIYGPDGSKAVIDSFKAADELRRGRAKDRQQVLARAATGALLATPEDRAIVWGTLRQTLEQEGIPGLPEEASDELLQSLISRLSGQEPKPVTFASPVQRYTSGGKVVLGRAGSDGRVYDVRTGAAFTPDDLAADPASSRSRSDYGDYLERKAREMGLASAQELSGTQEEDLRRTFYRASRAEGRQAGTPSTARARAASKDDPKFPRGVESYILQLRTRGETQADALNEVFEPRTWQKLLRDHPGLSATSVREAIVRLIPEEGATVDEAAPMPQSASAVSQPRPAQRGERRMINGVLAEWDGRGWRRVEGGR